MVLRRVRIRDPRLDANSLRAGGPSFPKGLVEEVKRILEAVKEGGDEALIGFIERFDGSKVRELKVGKKEIDEAYEKVPKAYVKAVEEMKSRLESAEKALLEGVRISIRIKGVGLRFRPIPLDSVGIYVPGGRAYYPSSLVMASVPAKVAGVERMAVASPPTFDGDVHPSVLVAADICGVDEVYRMGGAHAIAALAFGTESVRPVDKIVGPGGRFPTLAKLLVKDEVPIDMLAGPTELLVLADESADAKFIALDLISQAEHGEDSICGLVTTSESLAEKVDKWISKLLKEIERRDVVERSLGHRGFVALANDMEEALGFVNSFAPEHLELIAKDEEGAADKVRSAGVILLGSQTPTAMSDYMLGTNHILPTYGYARLRSGLSVLDFVKLVRVARCSKEAIESSLKHVECLSMIESLPNHYSAVRGRV